MLQDQVDDYLLISKVVSIRTQNIMKMKAMHASGPN